LGVTEFVVYDDDTLETENLPSQLYGEEHLGVPKAKALASEMQRLDSGVKVDVRTERVTPETELAGTVISMVDSMEARQEIWQAIRMNPNVEMFIDARMGAEIGQIRVLNPMKPSDCRRFEQSMEGQPVELPCTAKAIVYNGGMIAALISNAVKRSVNNEKQPLETVFSFPDLEVGGGLYVTTEQ
jgi:molybdopterin/thiamine biosynthesis adenylyltransferase